MIDSIESLLANNRRFVAEQLALDPAYFEQLAEGAHSEEIVHLSRRWTHRQLSRHLSERKRPQ